MHLPSLHVEIGRALAPPCCSARVCVQGQHVDSWRGATVGVLAPWTSAEATNPAFLFLVFLFVCLFCYPPTTPTPHRARGHWLRVWVWELSGLSSVLDSVLRPPAPDFTAQSLESSLLSGIVTAVPHRVSRRSNETLHAHGLDRCLATRRGSVRSDRCWSW